MAIDTSRSRYRLGTGSRTCGTRAVIGHIGELIRSAAGDAARVALRTGRLREQARGDILLRGEYSRFGAARAWHTPAALARSAGNP